ncbi:MAG TPA: hypothetical protein VK988_16185, partial [Acidimicrobiales bacterium]|nr:hypothetical protein [Acidimicrobiales bacterium]
AVDEAAREAGWSDVGREELPGATILNYRLAGVDARVSVARNRNRIGGALYTSRHGPTQNRRLALSSVTGALVGGTTAALYRKSRRGDKE